MKQTAIGKAAMYHDHLGEREQWREQENPEKNKILTSDQCMSLDHDTEG